jgi:hypothetical protein
MKWENWEMTHMHPFACAYWLFPSDLANQGLPIRMLVISIAGSKGHIQI